MYVIELETKLGKKEKELKYQEKKIDDYNWKISSLNNEIQYTRKRLRLHESEQEKKKLKDELTEETMKKIIRMDQVTAKRIREEIELENNYRRPLFKQ